MRKNIDLSDEAVKALSIQELEKYGYTISYGLDGVPYWLRKKTTKH